MQFLDYFSHQSQDYVSSRPTYPGQLFEWIASLGPSTRVALDCATGNGQAAVGLGREFDRVIAIDGSEAQLERALDCPRVEYRKAVAEETGLSDSSVDVVTVAQGIHWFEMDRFFAEANRVLRPGGALVIWGYGLPRIAPEVDKIIDEHYSEPLGPFWPAQRQYVDNEYATLTLPLNEIATPSFSMTSEFSAERVIVYVRSWSATRRYQHQYGHDPFDARVDELRRAWGAAPTREAAWPLYVRAGYFGP